MSTYQQENESLLEETSPAPSTSLNKKMIAAGVLTIAVIGSIGAYISPIGSSQPDMGGIATQSGLRNGLMQSDMPSFSDMGSVVAPRAENIITWNGNQFASITGSSPHRTNANCMNGNGAYARFTPPHGWVIAPKELGVPVIAAYPWGTHVMAVDNFCMYGVSSYSRGAQFSSCPSQYFHHSGNEYWIHGCHMDILIMRSQPEPTPSPIASPTLNPTAEPVADPTMEPTMTPTQMDNSCSFKFTKGTTPESVGAGCVMAVDHDVNSMKEGARGEAMIACSMEGSDLHVDTDMMDLSKLSGHMSYLIVGEDSTVKLDGFKKVFEAGKYSMVDVAHANDMVKAFTLSSATAKQTKLPKEVCAAGAEQQDIA